MLPIPSKIHLNSSIINFYKIFQIAHTLCFFEYLQSFPLFLFHFIIPFFNSSLPLIITWESQSNAIAIISSLLLPSALKWISSLPRYLRTYFFCNLQYFLDYVTTYYSIMQNNVLKIAGCILEDTELGINFNEFLCTNIGGNCQLSSVLVLSTDKFHTYDLSISYFLVKWAKN